MSDTPQTDGYCCDARDFCGAEDAPSGVIVVTADFARQLERELTALRESQMTEAKAREALGDWVWRDEINGKVTEKGNLHWSENNEVVNWLPWQHHPDKVNLLGIFTSLQLRAIAWWMDNKGEVRDE